jgi:hypothetical protein
MLEVLDLHADGDRAQLAESSRESRVVASLAQCVVPCPPESPVPSESPAAECKTGAVLQLRRGRTRVAPAFGPYGALFHWQTHSALRVHEDVRMSLRQTAISVVELM